MDLVIVESPSKAKTINKYLGDKFKVLATFGHVKELESKVGSVIPEADFKMKYVISESSKKAVDEICKYASKANIIYLATDPDREGEAISSHVAEILEEKGLKKEIKRIAFNAVTPKSVKEAIAAPRNIDEDLVEAQQTRRALDYLVGFNISPILWKKLPGSRSAGRVQSVALRIISDREEEIEKFKTQEYWDIKVLLSNTSNEKFEARLTTIDGKKLDKLDIQNSDTANKIAAELKAQNYQVIKIESKQQKRNPAPPFITSSLQQEAARSLGFTAKKTMQLAQRLYEGVEIAGEQTGLITYMRTDGTNVAEEAILEARSMIKSRFGADYLPKDARVYKTKSKNAQEAHEAIRPTNITFTPEHVKPFLETDQFRLYELIWKRLVASQMESALVDIVSADIKAGKFTVRATGFSIAFEGFYKLYKEAIEEGDDEEGGKKLPKLKEGENLNLHEVNPLQHFTQPPPRYSEASLVKKLEELGIGRPSTYASIISVLQDRQYVRLEKKRFIPEERGRLVTSFLVKFFPKYVQYDFTAKLEDELDEIAGGNLNWKNMLTEFWNDFSKNVTEVGGMKYEELNNLLAEELSNRISPEENICPSCGNTLVLKVGKFGAFLACSSYPTCNYTKQINSQNVTSDSNILGNLEGEEVAVKKGPYGWYIQHGSDKGAKKVAIPQGFKPESITLEIAKDILTLPRKLSLDGMEALINFGKFGPYIKFDSKFYSIPRSISPFEVDSTQAKEIINAAQDKASKDKAADDKTTEDKITNNKIKDNKSNKDKVSKKISKKVKENPKAKKASASKGIFNKVT